MKKLMPGQSIFILCLFSQLYQLKAVCTATSRNISSSESGSNSNSSSNISKKLHYGFPVLSSPHAASGCFVQHSKLHESGKTHENVHFANNKMEVPILQQKHSNLNSDGKVQTVEVQLEHAGTHYAQELPGTYDTVLKSRGIKNRDGSLHRDADDNDASDEDSFMDRARRSKKKIQPSPISTLSSFPSSQLQPRILSTSEQEKATPGFSSSAPRRHLHSPSLHTSSQFTLATLSQLSLQPKSSSSLGPSSYPRYLLSPPKVSEMLSSNIIKPISTPVQGNNYQANSDCICLSSIVSCSKESVKDDEELFNIVGSRVHKLFLEGRQGKDLTETYKKQLRSRASEYYTSTNSDELGSLNDSITLLTQSFTLLVDEMQAKDITLGGQCKGSNTIEELTAYFLIVLGASTESAFMILKHVQQKEIDNKTKRKHIKDICELNDQKTRSIIEEIKQTYYNFENSQNGVGNRYKALPLLTKAGIKQLEAKRRYAYSDGVAFIDNILGESADPHDTQKMEFSLQENMASISNRLANILLLLIDACLISTNTYHDNMEKEAFGRFHELANCIIKQEFSFLKHDQRYIVQTIMHGFRKKDYTEATNLITEKLGLSKYEAEHLIRKLLIDDSRVLDDAEISEDFAARGMLALKLLQSGYRKATNRIRIEIANEKRAEGTSQCWKDFTINNKNKRKRSNMEKTFVVPPQSNIFDKLDRFEDRLEGNLATKACPAICLNVFKDIVEVLRNEGMLFRAYLFASYNPAIFVVGIKQVIIKFYTLYEYWPSLFNVPIPEQFLQKWMKVDLLELLCSKPTIEGKRRG